MKNYVVLLLHLILWSGYTLTEWLSKDDQIIYNILMFFVFVYIAVILGNYILKSTKKTLLITLASLILYSSIHVTLNQF
ncbi:hypothetical protein FA727_02850 [Robertmurraya kyonggiensis]|uniref:Uncharacterized protein n=1 Tax=Robertmurraya kyonggiensis TaxID=1037680 RepID=A0A4U1DAB0_9BACI|nr:hypothetical protein FA727_02850 [Robertmurraya kyonggiensis]